MKQEKCGKCGQTVSQGSLNGYGECNECNDKKEAAYRKESGLKSDFGPEADKAILDAIAKFPETFRLRNHEGIFRIGRRASYVSQGRIMLYTQKLLVVGALGPKAGEWGDFAKGTIAELQSQVVPDKAAS